MATLSPNESLAGDLDDAATALVSDLALPSIERFSVRDDLAVSVAVDGELSRILGGLLVSRLNAIGADSVRVIDPGADADARARSAGAEWLLAVRGESKNDMLSLFAELRAIDRGIWLSSDPVAILATAEHRSTVSSIPTPTEPPPAKTDVARLEGPAIRVLSLEEHLLAMRACRVSNADVDDLIVLSSRALTVYSLAKGGIQKSARFELTALPRHKIPVREPIGSIACKGSKIAFGHSGLAKGRVLEAKIAKKRMELEVVAELAGIPLAPLSADRWLLAESDAGISRYKLALPAPILDAASFDGDPPKGWNLVAVTADYELVRVGDPPTAIEKLGPSGVGISAFLLGGKPYVVATGAQRDSGRDQLALYAGADASRPIAVEGLVFSTAVGRFRGSALDLIAAARSKDKTDLFLLRLWEPK
jgi:hypothetical protein